MCESCEHVQEVTLCYKSGLDEFKEIQSPQVKAFLREWFLPGDLKQHQHPLIFGSMTHWRAYEMLPMELFAY